MPVFFNGRLFVSPSVMSMVDDSAMANRNPAIGNVLALVGRSEGGLPLTPMRFGSPQEAATMLRAGPLKTAVERAFAPGPGLNGPATVVAVRVDPAVRSSLYLKGRSDGEDVNMIRLRSTDYGLWTNQIFVKVEAGTTIGRRLTTKVGDQYYTKDDVHRRAFKITYTGPEDMGSINVTETMVKLRTKTGSVITDRVEIDLTQHTTIQKLVDRINAEADSGWFAEVLDNNGGKTALNGLDGLQGAAVSMAVEVDGVSIDTVDEDGLEIRADLQACIDWFNSVGEGFMSASRMYVQDAAHPAKHPKNLAWTNLSGGTDGDPTPTEWANAFTALQAEDVQWVAPLTSDASIHSMAGDHCVYMSTIGRQERRAFVGGAVGTTLEQAVAAARLIGNDRVAYCFPGYYTQTSAGVLSKSAPYMTAALVGAGFASLNPGETMTNKYLAVKGLEVRLRNPTDTDTLINAGVLCLDSTSKGYRVVKAISTWRLNTNFNRVEISVGFATDYTARAVREAVERFIGEKGSPRQIALAASVVESTLRELSRPEPAGLAVLVGDDDNPAYKNIAVNLVGDVMSIEFQCSPVIPINYIPVTIHIVPYSGSSLSATTEAGALVGLE